MIDGKLIGAELKEADKANERASLKDLYCSNSINCPVFIENNKCIATQIFGSCPYAKWGRQESSSTKRGKAYGVFVREHKPKIGNEYPKMPYGYYKKCIQLIGDYCYLPYAHMNHKDGKDKIPFLRHSSFLLSGSDFMKKEDFTVETIVEIVKLKPMALMSSEITTYQKEQLPKFLFHLKYLFPELYKKVKKIFPNIEDKVLKLDESKPLEATIEDVPIGQTDGYVLEKNIKVKNWDGEILILTGEEKDFPFFLQKFKSQSEIEMIFKPIKKETKIIIKDNELKLQACINNPALI